MSTPRLVRRDFCLRVCESVSAAVVGGVARSQAFLGNGLYRHVLIARVDPQSFSLLDATCTLEGCVISRFAAPLYVCPCHGSRYDLLGAVARGPAPAALPQLDGAYAQGVLTVNI